MHSISKRVRIWDVPSELDRRNEATPSSFLKSLQPCPLSGRSTTKIPAVSWRSWGPESHKEEGRFQGPMSSFCVSLQSLRGLRVGHATPPMTVVGGGYTPPAVHSWHRGQRDRKSLVLTEPKRRWDLWARVSI